MKSFFVSHMFTRKNKMFELTLVHWALGLLLLQKCGNRFSLICSEGYTERKRMANLWPCSCLGKFWLPVLEINLSGNMYCFCLVDTVSKGSYCQEVKPQKVFHLSFSSFYFLSRIVCCGLCSSELRVCKEEEEKGLFWEWMS